MKIIEKKIEKENANKKKKAKKTLKVMAVKNAKKQVSRQKERKQILNDQWPIIKERKGNKI